MFSKITLLRGATALLYLGPLLAGITGLGWAYVPVFTVLFVLWLLFLRPEMWPGAKQDWRRGADWLTLVARAAVQVLLVAVLFGVGRGLGGVMGWDPAIPFYVPVALSSAAIVLGRLIWNPESAPDEK